MSDVSPVLTFNCWSVFFLLDRNILECSFQHITDITDSTCHMMVFKGRSFIAGEDNWTYDESDVNFDSFVALK